MSNNKYASNIVNININENENFTEIAEDEGQFSDDDKEMHPLMAKRSEINQRVTRS